MPLAPKSRVLALPAFRRLLVSYLLNELGDNVGIIALTILVFGETDSVWATTALFLVGRFVPALAAPALAARLEPVSIRRSLPALYLVEAALFGALALVAHGHFSLTIVLLLTGFDALVALTARSLSRAAVAAALQPTDQIRDGNALMNMALGLASTGGLALGGLVVSGATVAVALEINALSFILVATIVASPRTGGDTREVEEPVLIRLRAGFAFITNSEVHRVVLSLEALAIVLFTMVVPIEVAWVREDLNAGSAALGAVMGLWSAGILAGSVLFVRVRGGVLRVAAVATVLIGAAHTGMGLTSSVAIACSFALIGGVGNGMQWVAVTTLLQERTPPEIQGRLSAFVESLAAIMMGAGFVLGGAVAALTSPGAAIAVSGIAVLTLTASVVARRPPSLRLEPSSGAAAVRGQL